MQAAMKSFSYAGCPAGKTHGSPGGRTQADAWCGGHSLARI